MKNFKDLTGKQFGRLRVIERDYSSKRTRWICECKCGKIKSIMSTHLLRGSIVSCGCYQKERASKCSIKHGYTGTSIHNRWKSMIQRCNNPKSKAYKNYGARGINICKEWLNFENFLKWSLENGYNDNLELDRIDNNKGYNPNNCRWCTVLINNHNRRTTAKIEGIPLKDFSNKYNIKYTKVHYIYYRLKDKNIEQTTNNILKYANQLPINEEIH